MVLDRNGALLAVTTCAPTRMATIQGSGIGSSPTRPATPATRHASAPCGDAENGWWSVFGKKKTRKRAKAGAPSHDDLVRREFRADAPNRLWLADSTEHRTDEGKLYVCAIKDVFSNRIVGWSIDSRTKARLVVAALEPAVARRGDAAGRRAPRRADA